MNKKAFMLVDSLVVVIIVVNICLLCFSIYSLILKDRESSDNYHQNSNLRFANIFKSLRKCEACSIDESD